MKNWFIQLHIQHHLIFFGASSELKNYIIIEDNILDQIIYNLIKNILFTAFNKK